LGKREPEIILKTDERRTTLELEREGNFAPDQVLGAKPSFPRGRKLEVAFKTGPLGADAQAFGPASGHRAGQAQLRHGRVTVLLRSDGVTATLQRRCVTLSPVAVETGNGVANEKAKRLGGGAEWVDLASA
jgi:hypothetical protein